MFVRSTRWVLVSLLFVGLLWWGLYGALRREDLTAMRQLLQEKAQIRSGQALAASQQTRQGVVKDLWVSEADRTRLHHRICSESSQLTIVPKGHAVELIEKLEHIQCSMQDKLIPSTAGRGPFQQLRCLEADEGWYLSSNNTFTAHSVRLALYELPGHRLPDAFPSASPFLKGVARDVSFSLSSGSPTLNAEGLRAEFSPQGGRPWAGN